jgi:hypothetical protein
MEWRYYTTRGGIVEKCFEFVTKRSGNNNNNNNMTELYLIADDKTTLSENKF